MNYVIAVLPDQAQAEKARSELEADGVPTDAITIVGKGYSRPEKFGFLDPKQEAQKRASFMSYWLVPFGFVSGYAFNVQTGFELVPWAGAIGNHIIGGLFGAIAGAMGGFFIGGGFGLGSDDKDSPSYSDRLKAGKYLVVVNGPPNLTNKSNRILRQLKPETLQGFVDPNQKG